MTDLPHTEERALFAARRAVNAGIINTDLLDILRELSQSGRRSVREHAAGLACAAAAVEWARRHGGEAA